MHRLILIGQNIHRLSWNIELHIWCIQIYRHAGTQLQCYTHMNTCTSSENAAIQHISVAPSSLGTIGMVGCGSVLINDYGVIDIYVCIPAN